PAPAHVRGPAAAALPVRGRMIAQPRDAVLDERDLVAAGRELAELDANEHVAARERGEHAVDVDHARAVRDRARSGDRVRHALERLDVLEVDHPHKRREQSRRLDRVGADAERVGGVEADAKPGVDTLDDVEQLGRTQVAVVLEREYEAELACARSRDRERLDTAEVRKSAEARARRDAAHEPGAGGCSELEPVEQVAKGVAIRGVLDPVPVPPGDHDLEWRGVDRRASVEKARLERHAVDARGAGVRDHVGGAPANARLVLTGANLAEQTVVRVAVDPDPRTW